jgi:uncharacterized protein
MPRSCLYEGEVMHCRLRPVRHRFVYRLFSLLLDIDEIGVLGGRLRLFSHNRFNLVSFHDRDHGARDGTPLRPWLERHLRRLGIDPEGGRIFVHCLPRLAGYVFNPLSVYWCYDRAGVLRALLYEVKNTFGEQHVYGLPVMAARRGGTAVRQRAAKAFYVSPFIGMEAEYRFTIRDPEDVLSIAIREVEPEGELLIATHVGRRRPLADGPLLRALLLFPLVTLKVIGAIHWEALKLWLKGVRLHRRPPAPVEETRRDAGPRLSVGP